VYSLWINGCCPLWLVMATGFARQYHQTKDISKVAGDARSRAVGKRGHRTGKYSRKSSIQCGQNSRTNRLILKLTKLSITQQRTHTKQVSPLWWKLLFFLSFLPGGEKRKKKKNPKRRMNWTEGAKWPPWTIYNLILSSLFSFLFF